MILDPYNIFISSRYVKRTAYFLFRFINRLIPKNGSQVLLASLPDFSDNSKAIFCYMSANVSNYRLVWVVDDKELAEKLSRIGYNAYVQKSVMGLIQFIRSRFLLVTHGQYAGLKSKNQFLVDLWHGTPLKAMAFASEQSTKKELLEAEYGANARDILIATSTVAKNALASCFHIDSRKILITGQPRTDMLFFPDAKKNLSLLLDIDLSEFDNIILFCPTYRKWDMICPGRKDGKPKSKDIFDFNNYNIQDFINFLEKSNTLFLFKLHILEEQAYLAEFSEIYCNTKYIRIISTDMLKNNLIDIYEILGAIDILVTDYSSIYFDFLLLNRPIIFVPADFDEYSKTRGFVLEPYDFWTPGPKVVNFIDFITELANFFENPKYYENERLMVKDVIFKYQDNKSSERVWSNIEKIAKINRR